MPTRDNNVRFLLSWDITAEEVPAAFIRWQDWLTNCPPELGIAFRLSNGVPPEKYHLEFRGM
jgi:hypothetical protein